MILRSGEPSASCRKAATTRAELWPYRRRSTSIRIPLASTQRCTTGPASGPNASLRDARTAPLLRKSSSGHVNCGTVTRQLAGLHATRRLVARVLGGRGLMEPDDILDRELVKLLRTGAPALHDW